MCLHAKHVFSNQFGWYLSFNCAITEKCVYFDNDPYTKRNLRNSLLTETDRNFVIPERKMYYTLKKRGKYELATCYGHFWAIFGYVWVCISITDHNKTTESYLLFRPHNAPHKFKHIHLYYNTTYYLLINYAISFKN